MKKIKNKKQNRNKSLVPFLIVAVIVIIVVVFMLQAGGEKTIISNLEGILPIGDKSLQPPALPE